MKKKGTLYIYIASLLLFGSNGIVAAAIPLQSTQIVVLRTFIGAGFITLLLIMRKGRRRGISGVGVRDWVFIVASGVCTGASWITLYEAYREVGVGVASLEYYCAPLVVMIASVTLFHERLSGRKVIGFSAVLIGAVLLNGQVLQQGGSIWGLACGGMSALFHASMVIFSKQAHGVDGLRNTTVQLGCAFLTASLFLAATQGADFVLGIPASAWPAIAFLGLANTGIGCWMYFASIGRLPAQTVAVVGYLEPLSAVVLATAILNEPFTVLQVAGEASILCGALFAETGEGHVTHRLRREKDTKNQSSPS